MSSADYPFKNDDNSATRLNFQHWLIRQLCGYHLHPVARTISSGSDLRVADVGTGTGIWPIELSDEFPSTTRFDAFDITGALFPPGEWMPPNLHFFVQDAFAPFPEEYLGKYDIVAVRFLLTVVSNENVKKLLRNLASLLKPGGCLQWVEPDMPSAKAIKVTEESSTSATEAMVSAMKRPTPQSSYDWVTRLDHIFKEEGLEMLTYDRVSIPLKYNGFMTQVNLLAYEDACAKMEEMGMTERAEQGRITIEGVREESRQGVYVHRDIICTVVRKPLNG